MKTFFTLISILLFLCVRSSAQTCDSLQISFTVTESRCMATGSIGVTVSGGSGNFNYRAIGPVTTPFTNSTVISGLSKGWYTVVVEDIVNNCTRTIDSVFVPGTYRDPRFQLIKTNVSCAGNDGTISAVNLQFGRPPFQYAIVAPSPSGVGQSNTTGIFTNLTSGEYYVQLTDSCGGIQVRRITVENYYWWIEAASVVRFGCDSANVSLTLKDNNGKISTTDTVFNNYQYGVVKPNGDTAWHNASTFSVYVGTQTSLNLVVKDPCGVVHALIWTLPPNLQPFVGPVVQSQFTCSTFTAQISNLQNISSPSFCLTNAAGTNISCNTTGVFNNLPYGTYCIKVHNACPDTTITRCFTASRPKPSVGATVQISNTTCTKFTATITGQTNLIKPLYCLFNSQNQLITCDSTGVFNNLNYGSYCIAVKNGCSDTVIKRCFTAVRPTPVITEVNTTGVDCFTFNAHVNNTGLIDPIFCLYDSLGNLITCDSSGNFNNLPYGYYCVRALTACGDTTAKYCFTGTPPPPTVGQVAISNICTGFTATVTGVTNMTNPQYCLYNSIDTLVSCNTTGVFPNIPFGSYCIRIKGGCNDTTIKRCFSQPRPMPAINGNMQVLNSGCTSFTAAVSGLNLISPQYCLTDTLGNLIVCNNTGVFSNIPFGTYCARITDGCIDTTMKICQTFKPVRGLTLTASKSCTVGATNINVQFANSNAPYTVNVYRPDGTIAYTNTTSSNPFQMTLPALAPGQQYMVVAMNACTLMDTAFVTPDVSTLTKSRVIYPKCPTGLFQNGAGDVKVSCSTNFSTIAPEIIKKNGISFFASYSNMVNDTFTFSDLEPATYIVEYTLHACGTKLYDTFTVQPYTYPTQGQSTLYQCDNSGFTLSADVAGGLSPYSYQIIGSVPSTPSITTPLQTSPLFNINTGSSYSLVRLRTIDACGNATLSDVSVLPLQNFTVSATSLCFFDNITLSVDSIPNAIYLWYRKTTPIDSVFLDSGASYNIPFFDPNLIGRYVCKIIVNNGCLVRLVYIDMDGDCGSTTLPNGIQLKGRAQAAGNLLTWSATDDQHIRRYVLERKRGPGAFAPVGDLSSRQQAGKNDYEFLDKKPGSGSNEYRLKMEYTNGRSGYTSSVTLKTGQQVVSVYPNPAKEVVHISIIAERTGNFTLELLNAGGQRVYLNEIRNTNGVQTDLKRTNAMKPGIYLLKVTQSGQGLSETFRIVFE